MPDNKSVDDLRMALKRSGVDWPTIHRLDDIRYMVGPAGDCPDCNEHVLLALVDRLAAENARLEGWGQNTMDGCVGLLTKARDALYGVLAALGLGYGASELLDELDEAIRQLGAGKRRRPTATAAGGSTRSPGTDGIGSAIHQQS